MSDKFDTQSFEKQTPKEKSPQKSNRQGAQSNRKKALRNQKLFLRTFLYAMFVLVASLICSLFLLSVGNDALALVKPGGEYEVTIEQGSSSSEIANALKEANIIDYPWAFRLFSLITGQSSGFQYGTYTLNSDMDYLELTANLQRVAVEKETVTIMFPEGRELREIAATLEENGVCSVEDFMDVVENEVFDYDFLQDVPDRENQLEGYLFPDTYEFYTNEDPVVVIKKFLNNFNVKFADEFYTRAEELDMTIDEVVTLASIIEREAAGNTDRELVSSVFHNRLDSNSYPLLQSCATVQYVLQERKSVLSIEDTKIESPYNTYLYAGLPIGPIASPGLKSIEAALYPEESNYLFFVVGGDGEHIFSSTYEQHINAAANSNSSYGTGTVS